MSLDLQPHPTWTKQDSTKLKDYATCPRLYFLKRVLGWHTAQLRNDLAFGGAWAKAHEEVRVRRWTEGAFSAAIDAFMERYRRDFGPETDDLFWPKTPENGVKGILAYYAEYPNDVTDFVPLLIEVAGSVSVGLRSTPRSIWFRLDSIMQHELGIVVLEDKTTSSNFGRGWMGQWPLNYQVFTYNHVVQCLYGADNIHGVFINATSFNKTKGTKGVAAKIQPITFLRLPVVPSLDQMEAWLWEVNELMDDIDRDFDRLMSCSDNDPILRAFPRNYESCTKFFGCEFHPYCTSRANPLTYGEPPLGIEVRFWDPMEEPSREVVNI